MLNHFQPFITKILHEILFRDEKNTTQNIYLPSKSLHILKFENEKIRDETGRCCSIDQNKSICSKNHFEIRAGILMPRHRQRVTIQTRATLEPLWSYCCRLFNLIQDAILMLMISCNYVELIAKNIEFVKKGEIPPNLCQARPIKNFLSVLS